MVREPLVGRAGDLAVIDHLLDELGRGSPSALALVGEPGIGKSRLLAEVACRADASELLVLSGSSSELERDLPFSVFLHALDEYLQGLTSGFMETFAGEVTSELARVFPSLGGFASGPTPGFPHERYRVHRAVRGLLERLAVPTPLVLLLDDVHWADPASVELLGALLRRPPRAAVLMGLALRPGQVPERLSLALARAEYDGALTALEIGAFTRVEARAYLGDAIDEPDADALFEETGGNPFYLHQLARTRSRHPAASDGDVGSGDLGVPFLVAAALSEEIAVLPVVARLVLQGAAVVGDPFEPELAAVASATSESSVLDAIDELIRVDLVREGDVPRRFRFRHPIVRRAVYESAPAGWRLSAHQRCIDELARRGAAAVEQAQHIQYCGRRGDLAAVAALREAGTASAGVAPASAAKWFGEAIRLLPATAGLDERLELTLSRARSLVAAGQFANGYGAMVDGLQLVPRGAVGMRVRLSVGCAGIEHLLGNHDGAHARLVEALDGLPDRRSPEAVELMIELAMDGFFLMDYHRMRERAEHALAAARRLGDSSLVAAAACVLTFALAASGSTLRAQTSHSEAAAQVAAMNDIELATRLDAAANLAGAELYLNRYPEAEAHAARALSVAQATAQSEYIPLVYSILGQVKLLRGRLSDAGRFLDDAIEGARLSGNVQALAGNLVNRTLTALTAGDLDLARSTADENIQLTTGLDQSMVCAAGVALAATLLEQGDPRQAAEVLVRASGGDDLPFIPAVWRARSLELLTRCWLELGRQAEAEGTSATALTLAEALNLEMASALADRAAAAVALRGGDPAAAAEWALASADAADQAGAPVDAAVSRTLAGSALAVVGARDRAVLELRRAADELDGCGAVRLRAAAEGELRRLGHRVHRRTRPGVVGGHGVQALTERELQVARLIVQRRTNSEIAAALFLSRKTIETHIRNIFNKLNVTSRADVARLVEHSADPRRPDQT